MKRTKSYKAEWFGKNIDQEFADILFEELIVRNELFESVTCRNIHFRTAILDLIPCILTVQSLTANLMGNILCSRKRQ